jgi:hypothetical protein
MMLFFMFSSKMTLGVFHNPWGNHHFFILSDCSKVQQSEFCFHHLWLASLSCHMEDYLLICYIYISSCLLGTLFFLSLVRTQCCNSPTRVNNLQILPQFFCVLNEFPHYGSYIINFPILELFWQLGYMSPIRCVKLLECPCSVVIMGHHWDGCSSSRSIVHSLLWKATWTVDIADWIIMNLWSYIPM